MNLARFLKEDSITLDVSEGIEVPEELGRKSLADLKERILDRIVHLLDGSGKVVNRSKLLQDLVLREKKASTALGDGIAIPHVRTLQAREFRMAVALAPGGLPFEAPDDRPVRIFIAMIAPPHDDRTYLSVYQRIARALVEEKAGEAILAASSPGEIIRILSA